MAVTEGMWARIVVVVVVSDGDVIFMYLCQCSQTTLNDLHQSFVSLMTPRLGMTHI